MVKKLHDVIPGAPPSLNQPDCREAAAVPPAGDRRRTRYDPQFDACIPFVPSLWRVAGMAALSFVIVAGAALLIQLLVYHVNRLGTVLVAASVGHC